MPFWSTIWDTIWWFFTVFVFIAYLFALFAIFQPFSLGLFSIGCGLVVLGGLAFNLVPLCEPGRPARDLWRAAVVIAIVFAVVLALALASAWAYGLYLQALRP